ncbi:MAG: hypothetical protein E7663_03190 [Ruminococcaceae bacterium]|nr:hypothetical protein [Oscillospiraceae bacterium]
MGTGELLNTLRQNLDRAFERIRARGVYVPAGVNSFDLPLLIDQIGLKDLPGYIVTFSVAACYFIQNNDIGVRIDGVDITPDATDSYRCDTVCFYLKNGQENPLVLDGDIYCNGDSFIWNLYEFVPGQTMELTGNSWFKNIYFK